MPYAPFDYEKVLAESGYEPYEEKEPEAPGLVGREEETDVPAQEGPGILKGIAGSVGRGIVGGIAAIPKYASFVAGATAELAGEKPGAITEGLHTAGETLEKAAEAVLPAKKITKNLIDSDPNPEGKGWMEKMTLNEEVLSDPYFWINMGEDGAKMITSALVGGLAARGAAAALGTTAALAKFAPRVAATLAGLAGGGLQEGVQTAEDLQSRGATYLESAAGGGLMAVGSAILNGLALTKLMPGRLGSKLASSMTGAVTTEVATELAEGPLDVMIQQAIKGDLSWNEVERRLINELNVILPSIAMGGGTHLLAGAPKVDYNVENMAEEDAKPELVKAAEKSYDETVKKETERQRIEREYAEAEAEPEIAPQPPAPPPVPAQVMEVAPDEQIVTETEVPPGPEAPSDEEIQAQIDARAAAPVAAEPQVQPIAEAAAPAVPAPAPPVEEAPPPPPAMQAAPLVQPASVEVAPAEPAPAPPVEPPRQIVPPEPTAPAFPAPVERVKAAPAAKESPKVSWEREKLSKTYLELLKERAFIAELFGEEEARKRITDSDLRRAQGREEAAEVRTIEVSDEAMDEFFGETTPSEPTAPAFPAPVEREAAPMGEIRENPPQVGTPTIIEPSVVVKSPAGNLRGKGYALPGIESLRVVVVPPTGNKTKGTALGWSVWVGDKRVYANRKGGDMDTVEQALSVARPILDRYAKKEAPSRDTQNVQGIPSQVVQGQEPQQARPAEEGRGEEAPTGGVVQEPEAAGEVESGIAPAVTRLSDKELGAEMLRREDEIGRLAADLKTAREAVQKARKSRAKSAKENLAAAQAREASIREAYDKATDEIIEYRMERDDRKDSRTSKPNRAHRVAYRFARSAEHPGLRVDKAGNRLFLNDGTQVFEPSDYEGSAVVNPFQMFLNAAKAIGGVRTYEDAMLVRRAVLDGDPAAVDELVNRAEGEDPGQLDLLSPIAVRNPAMPIDVAKSREAYEAVKPKHLDEAGIVNAYDSRDHMDDDVRRAFEEAERQGKPMHAYYLDGEVHVDLSTVRPEDVPMVVLHEVGGHLGVENMLVGKDALAWWEALAKSLPAAKLLDAGERRFGKDYDPTNAAHRRAAAREVIAEATEAFLRGDPAKAQRSLWEKVKQYLRDLYRSIVGEHALDLTDFEIARIARDGIAKAEEVNQKFGRAMDYETVRSEMAAGEDEIAPLLARPGSPNRVNEESRAGNLAALPAIQNRILFETAERGVKTLADLRDELAYLKDERATAGPMKRGDLDMQIAQVRRKIKDLAPSVETVKVKSIDDWADRVVARLGFHRDTVKKAAKQYFAKYGDWQKAYALTESAFAAATYEATRLNQVAQSVNSDPQATQDERDEAKYNALLALSNAEALGADTQNAIRASARIVQMQKVKRDFVKPDGTLDYGKMMAALKKAGYSSSQSLQMLSSIDPNDTAAVEEFMKRMTSKPNFSDYVFEYFVNSWMSALVTQTRNIFSNALGLASKTTTSAIEEVLGKKPKGYTSTFVAGNLGAFWKGLSASWKLFTDENFHLDEFGTLFGEDYRASIPGLAGKIIRTPGRAARAMDGFFKIVVHAGVMNQQALIKAQQELGPNASRSAIAKRAAELVKDFDPTDPEYQKAINEAKRLTYQDVKENSPRIAKLLAIRNVPGGRWLMPFLRISLGQLAFTLDHSPHRWLEFAIKKFQNKEIDSEEFAKVMLGSVVFGSTLMAAIGGGATGAGPDDWRERKRLQDLAGWLPYAWKGETGYSSFSEWQPFATLMGFGPDMVETMRDKSDENKAVILFKKIARNLTDKSYMANLKNLVDMVYGEKTNYLENFATGVLPFSNLLAYAAQAQDPYRRKSSTLAERFMAKIPGMSQELKPERDEFGRPIKRVGSSRPWWQIMTLPFKETEIPKDPVIRAMFKHDIRAPKQADVIRGYEMSDEEFGAYMDEAGPKMYSAAQMWLTKSLKPEIAEERFRKAVARMTRPIKKRWLRRLVTEGKISRAAARKASAVEKEETYGQRLFDEE